VTATPHVLPVRSAAGLSARPVASLLLRVAGPATVQVIPADLAPGSWRWPVRWVDAVAGKPVAWCGERRRVHEFPANAAAWALAARLGCPDLAERIGLSGDLLVAGLTPGGDLTDVPTSVVDAAERAGLLGTAAPEVGPGHHDTDRLMSTQAGPA
jgi:hypothetical protein